MVRNQENTAWIPMTWYNTKQRSEDNKTWYDPYCTKDPCATAPVITSLPTTVTPSVPTTVTSTTTTNTTTTKSPTDVYLLGLSFYAYSKAKSSKAIIASVDVTAYTGNTSDYPDKTVHILSPETVYIAIMQVSLHNPTDYDINTSISAAITCGSVSAAARFLITHK
jgi:hypothetical protein